MLGLSLSSCGRSFSEARTESGSGDASADGAAADSAVAVPDTGSPSGSTVSGIVRDFLTGAPLSDRVVTIGQASTTTDTAGRFTIDPAPSIYDLYIVDPDGTAVSIYTGVNRRDPVLHHRRSVLTSTTASFALISGAFEGGPPFPIAYPDVAHVEFFSINGGANTTFGAGGPGFGPLTLVWSGSAPQTGVLWGLLTVPDPNDGGYAAWFGLSPLTVDAGEHSTATLPLVETPTAVLAGTVALPPDASLTALEQYYRVSPSGAVVQLGTEESPPTSFGYAISNIVRPDASLCVKAISASLDDLETELCDLTLPSNVTITLQQAPVLLGPPDGTTAGPSTVFSWTSFDNGVYDLFLQSASPSASAPDIDVFTDKLTTQWPEIPAIHLAVPSGADYSCTIGGLGPYSSLDDGLGSDGSVPATETRRSYGASIDVTFAR